MIEEYNYSREKNKKIKKIKLVSQEGAVYNFTTEVKLALLAGVIQQSSFTK